MASLQIQTPFGPVAIVCEGGALVSLRVGEAKTEGGGEDALLCERAARELGEYFAGQRRGFSLPLAPRGTEFQKRVWQALRDIPYGQTATYGDIARAIGKPKASRAVGAACHANPIWIVVPCHRVVGASGRLTGYAGGLDMKKELLCREGILFEKKDPPPGPSPEKLPLGE